MALTLARPAGNAPGGKGLALFYLETRDAEGRPNRLTVDRLKDKLGTRKVPTAELTLEAQFAAPGSSIDDREGTSTPCELMSRPSRSWSSATRKPLPLQAGHGLRVTDPSPRHMGQVVTPSLGSAPLPPQRPHASTLGT